MLCLRLMLPERDNTVTNRYMNMHTRMHTCTHTYPRTHTHKHAFSHTPWHYLVIRSFFPHCNTLQHTQGIANIVPETLTQGRHTHTHTHTHAHTRFLTLSVALPDASERLPTLQHTASSHTGHSKHRARDIDTRPTHTHTLHHLTQDIANIVPETLTQGRHTHTHCIISHRTLQTSCQRH